MRFTAVAFAFGLMTAPALASPDALGIDDVRGPISTRAWFPNTDDPAINYESGEPDNRVSQLVAEIAAGKVILTQQEETGFLPSLLAALGISQKSQLLVFSKTSLQQRFIRPQNPRAIYFADDVAVAFIHGAPFLEIAVQDPKLGLVFYTLDQKSTDATNFLHRTDCLACHISAASEKVAGTLVRSMAVAENGATMPSITNLTTDHRSPIADRWGGWFVTGLKGPQHLGNQVTKLGEGDPADAPSNSATQIDPGNAVAHGYLSADSDAAALMVFDHQMRMMNLITRMGWDARVALAQQQANATTRTVADELMKVDAHELVDYMLFVDEAPIAGRFTFPSGFAHEFSARGPHDTKGRSLYQLDLKQRLLRYPCSYLIYSEAFDALPDIAKQAAFRRMWEVLSGKDRDRRYRKISSNDRMAILEILRATKPGVIPYFH